MDQMPLLRRLSSFSLRHKSISPVTTPTPETLPTPPVWLDQLPLEVCTRVASFIINTSYQAVFNYSNISEIQRNAMNAAFEGTLDLQYIEAESTRSYEYSWDTGQPTTWLETDCIALLGQDVQEIRLTGSTFFPKSVQDCFKSPTLTKLVIHNRPCHFEYLLYVSNLRVLQISYGRNEAFVPFLKRISIPILDLQELSLKSSNHTCLHKHFSNNITTHALLASWFPRVEKLTLECGKCRGMEQPPSYLWHAMEKFRELKEVTLTECLPQNAVRRLRKMDRVILQDGDLVHLAEKIPNHVVSITATADWYHGPEKLRKQGNLFQRLAKCNRLEHLDCYIRCGTETSLSKVAANLRSLHIGFHAGESADYDIQESHMLDLKEPRTDAIIDALKMAPFLTSVHFTSMPMRANNVCEMLAVLGEPLEEFSTSIFSSYWKNKSPGSQLEGKRQEFEDIIDILSTAALHNPSLEKFHLTGFFLLPLQAGDLVEGSVAQDIIFPLLPTFQASVTTLRRRAPRLDVERWEMLLRQLRASCSQKVSFSEESEWSE